MLALVFDTGLGEGDLAYSGGKLVSEGLDLETAVTISLLCDAPAQPGDVLTPGTPRRGWWGDVFDQDGVVTGSRLWLLEEAEVTEATASRARIYAREALAWLVSDGHVAAVGLETELGDEAILLTVAITLKTGRVVNLGPFEVT